MVILAGRSQWRDDTLFEPVSREPIMDTIKTLKSQARRLRSHLAEQHISLSHSQTLEAIAASHGFKDWNTACALTESAIAYPSTNETLEQLTARFNEMGRVSMSKGARGSLSDEEKVAVNILLHQIGVAAEAAYKP